MGEKKKKRKNLVKNERRETGPRKEKGEIKRR